MFLTSQPDTKRNTMTSKPYQDATPSGLNFKNIIVNSDRDSSSVNTQSKLHSGGSPSSPTSQTLDPRTFSIDFVKPEI